MKYFQLNKWLLGKKHMNFVPFGFPEKITLSESYWILVKPSRWTGMLLCNEARLHKKKKVLLLSEPNCNSQNLSYRV